MRLLTRAEELVLLSVWRLQDKAYSVHIREQLMEVTGQYWSFGAIYMPLDRLVKKKLLESYLADPTPERGGRSKRIYKHTPDGLRALIQIREVERAMWKDIPELSLDSLKPRNN